MRVSEFYELGKTQPSLDFVDVDIVDDTPFFIDPQAIRGVKSQWADECVALLQNYFSNVLRFIKKGHNNKARTLLLALSEPNETHLGLSRGRSKGRGLGRVSSTRVWRALQDSEAVKSGLLVDLEDTALLVPGIQSDLVSDITTNIIRAPLIHYTQKMAEQYGIPLVDDVASGILWDPGTLSWAQRFERLPMTPSGKLLLVPKLIVRKEIGYNVNEYFRHFIIERLRAIELAAGSALVHVLKNGRPRVTKKDLMEKYGTDKRQ